MKRLQKLSIIDAYHRDDSFTETVHCLLGLPLLSAGETAHAVSEIRDAIDSTPQLATKLQ